MAALRKIVNIGETTLGRDVILMSEETIDLTDFETAIQSVYRGSLEEFVRRRDTLAKQLRSDKRREDAERVKALRKPSRTAWLLNNIVYEDPAPIDRLAAAIAGAQDAQSGSGADLRTALENVRAAVRDVASAGARAGVRFGHPVDATSLVSSVNALIGDANAFGELRAGLLVDIPEGGGLDFLAAIASPAPKSAKTVETRKPAERTDSTELKAARKALQSAETVLADASERARAAERALTEAQTRLDAAEKQLQRAKEEAESRRAERERRRGDAEAAGAELKDAERLLRQARERVEKLDREG